MTKTAVPQYHALMNPLLQALKALGGSGTNEEIENKVAEIMDLSDQQLEVLHNPTKGGQTQSSTVWPGHAPTSRNAASSTTPRVAYGH